MKATPANQASVTEAAYREVEAKLGEFDTEPLPKGDQQMANTLLEIKDVLQRWHQETGLNW